ncbi:uncharacterized protein LOC135146384 isoform X2 [Zophobas morio]|jgi:ubiquinol-cytochrome c reductase iron-sulfur subunit|uniref:uncharacterized protein LOC135146384 isoform X2 n=1 Tax=Zophobas morio TaxID=2755281 RepID=UPI0030827321
MFCLSNSVKSTLSSVISSASLLHVKQWVKPTVSNSTFNDPLKVYNSNKFKVYRSTALSLLGAIRFAHTDLEPPSFDCYRRGTGRDYRGEYQKSRVFTYLMTGGAAIAGSISAKNIVHSLVGYMAPSEDVLALAKVEVGIKDIPEGSSISVMWRGKPLFIRHRTQEEIDEANSVDITSLRHPEADSDRVKDPRYLIMIGVCTHLGCIPVGEAGDYGGWFCPCHGSHYDISGRIRKGPAPTNMEIPPYVFVDNNSAVVVG